MSRDAGGAIGWATIRQRLEPANFSSHFGGKNDGVIHFPLQAVEFDLGTAHVATGSFELANLSLACSSCLAKPLDGWRVEIGSISSPAVGVVTAADAATPDFAVTMRLTNLHHTASSARASLWLRPDDSNSTGARIGCIANEAVSLRGWESQLLSCVPAAPLVAGFYSLEGQLSVGAASSSSSGGLTVLETNLSTVPAVGVFGSQMARTPESYAALRAVGASNFRVWVFWRYAEGTEGRYELAVQDSTIQNAVDAGMRVTLTIASRAPTWATWSKDPSGMWPD